MRNRRLPPVVVLETLRAPDVRNVVELSKRIELVRKAEVYAEVNGIVLSRLLQKGSDVAAGQSLFHGGLRKYRALVGQAAAALARA